ncbi:MAG: hypothetical protein HPY50_18380 [Firmicutes bacterium]|nr:hypothetical protein [Bacillota bacterium]
MKKITLWLLLGVVVVSLGVLAAGGMRAWSLLAEEGDPQVLSRAIRDLEMGKEEVIQLDPVTYLMMSGDEGPLVRLLERRGWSFGGHVGEGLWLKKGKETLYARPRVFHQRYVIYELNRQP